MSIRHFLNRKLYELYMRYGLGLCNWYNGAGKWYNIYTNEKSKLL